MAKERRNSEQDRFFILRDDDLIEELTERISNNDKAISASREKAKNLKENLARINKTLAVGNMMIFKDGQWQ